MVTRALTAILGLSLAGLGGCNAFGIANAVHDAGCRAHPTQGHIHDGPEAVIRERLGLLKHAARQRGP